MLARFYNTSICTGHAPFKRIKGLTAFSLPLFLKLLGRSVPKLSANGLLFHILEISLLGIKTAQKRKQPDSNAEGA